MLLIPVQVIQISVKQCINARTVYLFVEASALNDERITGVLTLRISLQCYIIGSSSALRLSLLCLFSSEHVVCAVGQKREFIGGNRKKACNSTVIQISVQKCIKTRTNYLCNRPSALCKASDLR